MDASTLMKIVMSQDSTAALEKLTGASGEQVGKVLNSVMPVLLNGASEQASGKDTAAAFSKAIEDHSGADTRNLAAFFGGVDKEDGNKIVNHLLGGSTTKIITAAAKAAGVNEKTVKLILTTVAPLLLSILGQQKKKHGDLGSELLKAVVAGTAAKVIGDNKVLGVLGKLLG